MAEESNKKYNKKHIQVLLCILGVAVLCLLTSLATHYVSVDLPKDTYAKAKKALKDGDYQEADRLLKKIPGYGDVDEMAEQILDENDIFLCLRSLNTEENLDVIQIYQGEIYRTEEKCGIILVYGVMGDDGDLVVKQGLFQENGEQFCLVNEPIVSTENVSNGSAKEKETRIMIQEYRKGEDESKANLGRINDFLSKRASVINFVP